MACIYTVERVIWVAPTPSRAEAHRRVLRMYKAFRWRRNIGEPIGIPSLRSDSPHTPSCTPFINVYVRSDYVIRESHDNGRTWVDPVDIRATPHTPSCTPFINVYAASGHDRTPLHVDGKDAYCAACNGARYHTRRFHKLAINYGKWLEERVELAMARAVLLGDDPNVAARDERDHWSGFWTMSRPPEVAP